MPWYFVTYDGQVSWLKVKTGARALCFWQLIRRACSLVERVQWGRRRSVGQTSTAGGDRGVARRQRRRGALQAVRAFCSVMCEKLSSARADLRIERLATHTARILKSTLRDADMVAELSSANAVRPFVVIDMGWENWRYFTTWVCWPRRCVVGR
jgi:hypothetical protein